MSELRELKFKNIYGLADLIDNSVKSDVMFSNYENDYFVKAAAHFSKNTLLHHYIVTTALNYYKRDFRKNWSVMDDEIDDMWYFLFDSYSIKIRKLNLRKDEKIIDWFNSNIKQFESLFTRMAEEVFYLLFSNREFLLNFNNVATETVRDTTFKEDQITLKGTIKRVNIPVWVKKAIFHRDKGRCVFCNKDLTGLVNTLSNLNYDHIMPLDLYGTNDPCNIQLTCEKCNKKKKNKKGITSNKYAPWWTK